MDAELPPLVTFASMPDHLLRRMNAGHPSTYCGEPSRVGTFTAAEVNQVLAADRWKEGQECREREQVSIGVVTVSNIMCPLVGIVVPSGRNFGL
ncbi:hypothetical protein [Sinorhizobium psoraleae]|uniref:Uncharacterized protein n=1 Tax=Sinorhizobium psoraleae TaxID=520838 RepID=A0ABT4KNT5_9HYPH|nr:hypothetical protein [Sinorhizobium psoraleae]MCZ4093611.1 hypothetical protein [Sinorhizobium psoraleae]